MRRREPRRCPSTAAPSKSLLDELSAVAKSFPYGPAAVEALSGDMGQIIGALPPGIPPRRLMLFREVLREWWDWDLQQHRRLFSDASRAVDRMRGAMLDEVSKAAGKLCNALAMLDDRGRAQVAFWALTSGYLEGKNQTPEEAEEWLAAVASRSPPSAVQWLERFVERRPGRSAKWPDRKIEWLAGLAAIGGRFDQGKPRSGWRDQNRSRPRALLSDAVIFDLAAIFEWVTGSAATRRIHGKDAPESDQGRAYGPFHAFASAVWPLIFGSLAGLSNAAKRRAAAHRKSNARSEVIANIASRHPEWRLFDENS
jgi:hypothetical protein